MKVKKIVVAGKRKREKRVCLAWLAGPSCLTFLLAREFIKGHFCLPIHGRAFYSSFENISCTALQSCYTKSISSAYSQ